MGISQIVDIDVIREVLRGERLKKEDPYLFLSSCTAWERHGENTKERVIESYIKYCQSLDKSIKRIIERAYKLGKDTIIEGVHLLPINFKEYLNKKNFHMIIISCEEERHLENLIKRKKEFNQRPIGKFYKRFPFARIINEYLKEKAKKLNILCIDNYSLKKTEKQIINLVNKNEKNN